MLGGDKCPKCGSEKLEQEDYNIDFIEEKVIHVSYDVWCGDCKHEFEIIDVFKYSSSKEG